MFHVVRSLIYLTYGIGSGSGFDKSDPDPVYYEANPCLVLINFYFNLTAASPSCGSAASTARTVRSCVTARTPSEQRASARGSSSATGRWSAGSGSAFASQSSPYDGAGYSGTYCNTTVEEGNFELEG
jgi:hypothetical protein